MICLPVYLPAPSSFLQAYWYAEDEIANMLDKGAAFSPGTHTSISLDYTTVNIIRIKRYKHKV